MSYLSGIKSYLNKEICFVRKCKAHCCVNPPLPEKWVAQNKQNVQRRIFDKTYIGKNAHFDNDASYIYNTRPIQYVGQREDGKALYGISKETMNALQIKSMKDIDAILKQYDGVQNYCPFITDYGKCSVYEKRPTICREFGTLDTKLDKCPEKATKLEVIKFYANSFFDALKNLWKKSANGL